MTETKSLQIHGLQVENYKRIRSLAVTFDGAGTFAVMGGNEQGKSSMFDALEAVLAGRKAPKQAMPVRKGAEKATIIADFGDVIVKRVYQPGGGTTLKVTNGDGFADPTPEDTMRRLYSHVALDPLEFANLPAKEQADVLLSLVGFDPRPIDAAIETAFKQRTVANGEVKALRARLDAFPPVDTELSAEPVSSATIREQIATVEAERREHADGLARISALLNDNDRMIDSIDEWKRQIALCEAQIEKNLTETRTLEVGIASTEPPSTDALFASLATLEQTNDRIREQAARADVATELAAAETRAAQLTATIDEGKAEKAEGLASHPLPVPGLEVIDGEVHLDGTPFSQSSTGAKIRTSVGIAMALNPTLRTILVRDANTLDKGNRQTIHDLALEHGFTVLLELVNTDEDRGIVIVDGAVAEVRS